MKGRIVRWEDSKGFGFIKSAEHNKDIFIHASKFPQGQRRPRAGDLVEFDLDISTPKSAAARASLVGEPVKSRKRSPSSSIVFGTILLPLVVWLSMDHFSIDFTGTPQATPPEHHQSTREALGPRFSESSTSIQPSQSLPSFNSRSSVNNNAQFSCTGKQHCSQMRSCDEAKFYLRNCPNVKIDGDNDGLPCERQLCR